MEPCHACDASMSDDAEWCSQCYAPAKRAGASSSGYVPAPGSIMAPTRQVKPATLQPTVVKTRWRKTATTFGPVGRVLATLFFVVPFVIAVIIGVLTGGFFIDGAVVWGIFVMPLGLRDVWKAGQLTTR